MQNASSSAPARSLVPASAPHPIRGERMLSRSPVAATLPVKDLKQVKSFYGQKLGLKLTAGSVREGFLEFRAGKGSMLMFFQSDAVKHTGNTNATFEVANLARTMAALRKKGVEFKEYDLPGVKTVDGV